MAPSNFSQWVKCLNVLRVYAIHGIVMRLSNSLNESAVRLNDSATTDVMA